jgi:hypothetical protein
LDVAERLEPAHGVRSGRLIWHCDRESAGFVVNGAVGPSKFSSKTFKLSWLPRKLICQIFWKFTRYMPLFHGRNFQENNVRNWKKVSEVAALFGIATEKVLDVVTRAVSPSKLL